MPWHKTARLYSFLAGLNVLALLLGAWVTIQIIGAYETSQNAQRLWRERRDDYQRLTELAMAINAPGNDVFDTGSPDREEERLHAAVQAFHVELARLREHLTHDVNQDEARAINLALQNLDAPIIEMISHGEQVLYWFRRQNLTIAGRKMAQMNHAVALFMQARTELIREIGAVETAAFRQSEARIARLEALWLSLAGVMTLLVAGTIWYGRRLTLHTRLFEQARDQSDHRYRLLIETARDAVFSLSPDGLLLSVNPAFEHLSGWRAEEWLGKPYLGLLHPEDIPLSMSRFRRVLAGETIPPAEMRFRTASGRYLMGEVAVTAIRQGGHVTGILGIARDISERKQAEEALRRVLATLDTTTDGVFIFDPRTLVFSYANEGAAHQLGYSREELRRMTPLDIKPEFDEPRFREMIAPLLNGAQKIHAFTTIHRRKDGVDVPVEINLQAVDVDTAHARLIAVVRDISERKRAEQALQTAHDDMDRRVRERTAELSRAYDALQAHLEEQEKVEAQLRQAQKMDAVGRLAGGVAHDFNNILTVIMGYSDLLIRHLGPAHALIRHVREIRKASERAGTLTQQLLAFSRQQVLQPKRLNLNTVIRDLSTMLHRLIGEDVELVLTLDPELGFAHADPGTLEQTLMNLAINARDAMAGGGRLMIGTTNTEFAQPLTTATGTLPAGSYVALRAADTGSGMDADILSKIFEPFFTTKEPGKGTGLGLAMVHGIVSQIGGAIDVKSQPGLGTTFTIYLPRAIQAGSLSAQPPLLPATHAMRGTETVLLVEDEEQVRAMAREILGAYGYTVVTAADGMEGLEQAKTHAGPIHLLLTDVVMPKMRGRELAELVSMLRTDVKVLYMSGYTDDPKLQQDVTGHHSRLLRKPFSPTQLLEAVRETLGPLVGSR